MIPSNNTIKSCASRTATPRRGAPYRGRYVHPMKHTFTKIFASFLLCLAFAASAQEQNQWIEVKGGSWRPSISMLNELKTNIRPYVEKAAKAQARELKPWRDYTFQYQGIEEKRRRFIFVSAFCTNFGISNLTEKLVLVEDGGSCFFTSKYDPERKEFSQLFINGEA